VFIVKETLDWNLEKLLSANWWVLFVMFHKADGSTVEVTLEPMGYKWFDI